MWWYKLFYQDTECCIKIPITTIWCTAFSYYCGSQYKEIADCNTSPISATCMMTGSDLYPIINYPCCGNPTIEMYLLYKSSACTYLLICDHISRTIYIYIYKFAISSWFTCFLSLINVSSTCFCFHINTWTNFWGKILQMHLLDEEC